VCPTPPPSFPAELLDLAREADAQVRAARVETAIMWLTSIRPDSLVWFPLAGAHPLELLLRFVAPEHWSAIGVAGAGSARSLDESGRPLPGSGPGQVFVTVVVHRSGAAVTLMTQGDGEPRAVPEPPEGVVADACRRALGLPTTAPPASTTGLWSLCWLDRLVEAASAGRASTVGDWHTAASLHPAAGPAPLPSDPPSLARATKLLAAAWPWSRLRDNPETVNPPGLETPPDLARWMDDGMWARWLLSAYPVRDDLLASVYALLPTPLADAVTQTIEEC
jgi:hypothetical protein